MAHRRVRSRRYDELTLCLDVRWQIPEKAFGGDRAPTRTAMPISAASRRLLAWERLLRLGAVAPRKAESDQLIFDGLK